MVVMAAAVLVGLIAGWATGGVLSQVANLRIRAWPALVAALALQGALGAAAGSCRTALALTACLAIATWCAANFAHVGLRFGQVLIGTGVALNAMVMALNGGMPVSAGALATAGFPKTLDVAQGHLYKHTPMVVHTRLRLLGDIIPFHLAHMVLSPGDLLMLVGIAAVTFGATRPHGRPARSTGQIGQSNAL